MNYIEVDICLEDINSYHDILIAQLNEIGFESYLQDKNGVKAYVPKIMFNNLRLRNLISKMKEDIQISYNTSEIKQKNWNKIWEENFEPVFINKECVIRAHFHDSFPDYNHDIIITPKMSFGTGHHETTELMINSMFNLDFNNKNVLDVGTGTGILSILSSRLGAKSIIAIDIDDFAYDNAKENALLNKVVNIKFLKGTIYNINKMIFDILLVNINRNVILNDLLEYSNLMNKGSEILLSGFLDKDRSIILDNIKELDFKEVNSKKNNQWQILHLSKV